MQCLINRISMIINLKKYLETKMTKKRSASSTRWLKEHFSDKYVQQSKKYGLRSRSWFKLDEIQKKNNIFSPGMTVLDFGAAPGSWSQYAVKKTGRNGTVIACDILPLLPIPGVNFLQGDCCDPIVINKLNELVSKKKAHIVLSDIAPNMSGMPDIDIPKSIHLVETILDICQDVLAPGGSFLVKVFQGEGFDSYLRRIRSLFMKVKTRKLDASRARSREVYIMATGFK